MSKEEKKKEDEVLLMEESAASSITAANFEPDKGHSLIYFKLIAMNQPALKSTPIQDHVSGGKGYLAYGTIDELRKYLHSIVDTFVDAAADGAKLNP